MSLRTPPQQPQPRKSEESVVIVPITPVRSNRSSTTMSSATIKPTTTTTSIFNKKSWSVGFCACFAIVAATAQFGTFPDMTAFLSGQPTVSYDVSRKTEQSSTLQNEWDEKRYKESLKSSPFLRQRNAPFSMSTGGTQQSSVRVKVKLDPSTTNGRFVAEAQERAQAKQVARVQEQISQQVQERAGLIEPPLLPPQRKRRERTPPEEIPEEADQSSQEIQPTTNQISATGGASESSLATKNQTKIIKVTRGEPVYTFDINDALFDDDHPNVDPNTLPIRSWGCQRRQDAPFIFVHIGKAGGGSVRARIAASAMDYGRGTKNWADSKHDATYHYPMMHGDKQYKGVFANSVFSNFRPSYPKDGTNFTEQDMDDADHYWKTYERTLPCAATTPLGQSLACPLPRLTKGTQPACRTHRCNVVYTGHNLIGNEMHWLSSGYLARWWARTPWTHPGDTNLLWKERALRWRNPDDSSATCHYERKHPTLFYKRVYHQCVAPKEDAMDELGIKAFTNTTSAAVEEVVVNDWSPIYASLPVLRVTVMREPFSWLVSKFFWHSGMKGTIVGTDGEEVRLDSCDYNGTNYEAIATWARSFALKQINHLCGEDCLVRLYKGTMTLQQAERQARHNLQHSFAVVGLLHETQTFYDMVTARVAYMDTSLNPEVVGAKHSTAKKLEYQRCSEIYITTEFQEKLLAVCPELRALHRLYQVGVAVNRHQLQEMQTCGSLPSSTSPSVMDDADKNNTSTDESTTTS